MRRYAFIVAGLFTIAPPYAHATDLVVWWDKGFYHEEDAAIEEVIAAFEQKTGKQVDLVLDEQAELPDSIEAAIAANQPPDVAFGLWLSTWSC